MYNKEKNFASSIIYVHNSEDMLEEFLDTIISVMEDNFENNRRGRRPNYNNINRIQRNYSSNTFNSFIYENSEEDLMNNSDPTELTPYNVDDPEKEPIDLTDFHKLEFDVLKKKVEEFGIDTAGLDRDGLKKAMLELAKLQTILLRDTGVMERVEDKKNPGKYWGYLRHGNFSQSPYDIYISHSQMVKFGLRDGDIVTGLVRSPKAEETYHCLLKIPEVLSKYMMNLIPYRNFHIFSILY